MVAKQKKTHRIYNMCSRPLLMAGPLFTAAKYCPSCAALRALMRDCNVRWDAYADTYLLTSTRAKGPSTCVRVSCSTKPISAKRGAIPIL